MRILVHGRFHPSVGGIETIVDLLAREWAAAGHELVIISNLPCGSQHSCAFPFRVVYTPGPLAWWRLVKWADVVLQMNLSLKAFWPHLVLRRPLIISHQSCYRSYPSYSSHLSRSGKHSLRQRLKLRLMSRATNIAASHAISRSLCMPSEIIPNPYDSALFNHPRNVPRDRNLIFVGRLVSEKGVDLLLAAMRQLEPPWDEVHLTIVGDGPERSSLQKQAAELDLTPQVIFLGALDRQRVAQELRRHQILVIPSFYEEPFGVVALEGAASGCLVLGSDGGGLPEAIGPGGTTFRRGDPVDLASRLMRLLRDDSDSTALHPAVRDHLAQHCPAQIASEYLRIFRQSQTNPWKPESIEACLDCRGTD